MNADGRLPMDAIQTLDFTQGGGLLPAIVQHAGNGTVLMLGYMNREALEATFERGRVVFFSRSKDRLWEKGETSGHSLELASIRADCDRDAVLVTAWPRGPTCHLGANSCFGSEIGKDSVLLLFLSELEDIIARRISTRPQGSYTAELVASGMKRIAQKVSEEGLELALAAAGGTNDEVVSEASDVLYHLLVLLKARGLSLNGVLAELRARNVGHS